MGKIIQKQSKKLVETDKQKAELVKQIIGDLKKFKAEFHDEEKREKREVRGEPPKKEIKDYKRSFADLKQEQRELRDIIEKIKKVRRLLVKQRQVFRVEKKGIDALLE